MSVRRYPSWGGTLAIALAVGLLFLLERPAVAEIVAHWSLDDGQVDPNSLTATDAVSPAANAVWQGSTVPRWINGALGGAASFGGAASSSDRDDVLIVEPDAMESKLDFTGALTISSWIFHNEFGGQTSTRHIAGKDQGGGPTGDAYSLKHNMSDSADTLQFLIASGGVNTNLTSGLQLAQYSAASQNGGWIHVGGVFQPGEYMRLYIDGFLDNELTGAEVPLSIDSMPTTNFTIGRLFNGASNSFHGSIDDVQVYGQALDTTQIQTLYGNPGQVATGLVGHWMLDDGVVDPNTFTATDAVSPAEHGTWQNLTNPRWVSGLIGGAADFGGSTSGERDDVISVVREVSGNKLDITGAVSVAAWVRLEDYGSPASTRHIAGKDRAGGPAEDVYSLKHNMIMNNPENPPDTLQFLIAENGANTNLVSSSTLTEYTAASQRDGWVHVTGVFQPGEYMRLYIDGELDAENTFAVPNGIDLFSSTPFTIGRLHNSNQHSFNGGIDDVRVYDHALSIAEIEALVAMVPIGGIFGDHNDDGFVNAADYVFWRDTMGDLGRYNEWRDNFGDSAGAGTNSAVPEPQAFVLFLVMVTAVAFLRVRESSLAKSYI